MNILEKIVIAKKKSLEEEKNKLPLLEIKKRIKDLPPTRNFSRAISSAGKLHLIAEIKKTSPSGSREVGSRNWDVVRIAQEYELAGASAISVLTEKKFFLGNLEYIKQVKKVCKLPVLRKDFIFDAYQIYQSRYYEADAFLLIATLFKKGGGGHLQIEEFIALGQSLGMEALVEVHNEEELEQVLNTSAKIRGDYLRGDYLRGDYLIGINNRNLEDLTVDLKVTLRLLKKYQEVITSKGKIIVSESGIKTKKDVELLRNTGVNAVLIGETLMQSKNIREKVKELGLT